MPLFRRIKVLTLVVLLSLLNFCHFTKSVDVTYILKQKQNYYEPNCIAEGDMLNSAIGWIYPLPDAVEKIPKISTKFIPTVQTDYNCNFSKENHCNVFWKKDSWKIETSSPRNFVLLLDTRWQDLPVILTSNNTKEFGKKIEIPGILDLGISIRTSNTAELFLCEGWNPRIYPCYYIHIGKRTFLQKTKGFPLNKTRHLDVTTSDTAVLLEDEWRNFVLSFDKTSTIRLLEVFKNESMLKFKDDKPLKPIYLFMRSNSSALWKVHQNYFLQTTVPKTTKLGPIVKLNSNKLCLSMYISLCENCNIRFSLKNNNQTEILQESFSRNESLWQYIILQKINVFDDEIQLFVTTELINKSSDTSDVFWAIDDVRICDENEIKVTTLMPNDFIKSEENGNEYIFCQAIELHKWRPEQHIHPILNVFPGIERYATSTSIQLTWKPYPTPIPALSYLIEYQGADTCMVPNKSNKRVKSNGQIVTKEHDITIENLIPYTYYNISFSYILHDNKKIISLNTLPTETPTNEETPMNFTVTPDSTSANLYFKTPNCNNIYGPLCYMIKIANYSKQIYHVPSEVNETVPGLKPFTNYSLEISFARKCNEFSKQNTSLKKVYTFVTKPDTAPSVENLELYSTDFDSVSLRYDLPAVTKGVPKNVQVKYCNVWLFDKCNSEISEIKTCKLWPNKYCIDVNDLLKMNNYTFDVSLKNLNTHSFGKDVRINGSTTQRVPGKPTNITYKMVNCEESLHYCHLNVSWLHPYEQNGTITSFYIILNKTDENTFKSSITQMYKIPDKTYLPEYHQIIKYVPYSTHYNLSMKTMNYQYESEYTTPIYFKTEDIGDHIDQGPKLIETTGNTFSIQIPQLDDRLDASVLYVIVQDYDKNVQLDETLDFNQDDLCNKFGNTWLALVTQLSHNTTQTVIIGDNTLSNISHKIIINKPLHENTRYCLTFIVKNSYQRSKHEVVYYEKNLSTTNVPSQLISRGSNSHLYVLVVMLLLVPIGFLVYKFYLKSKSNRRKVDDENIYESLPFEEYNNFVSNDTYDKLIHT